MYMTAFGGLFPEQAMHETRVLTVLGHPVLPDDEYGLIEFYCTDKTCDCQMVMLHVVGSKNLTRNLASICYVFDPTEKMMTEPMLDIAAPASQYADILLEMVKPLPADPLYVERIKSHYRQVKKGKLRSLLLKRPTAGNLTKPKSKPGSSRKKR
jgi:hypothetical protein